jgi:hypothetical protein
MDPDACLLRLSAAFVMGDLNEQRDAADDLREWIARGGFMPRVDETIMLRLLGGISANAGALLDASDEDEDEDEEVDHDMVNKLLDIMK